MREEGSLEDRGIEYPIRERNGRLLHENYYLTHYLCLKFVNLKYKAKGGKTSAMVPSLGNLFSLILIKISKGRPHIDQHSEKKKGREFIIRNV